MTIKCFAVVVVYKPDYGVLKELLNSIYHQVECVIIANNSDRPFEQDRYDYPSNLRILEFGGNVGIGAASNKAVMLAHGLGCSHIVLSDQDSLFPEGYVKAMLSVFKDSTWAVAPLFRDHVSGKNSAFYAGKSVFGRRCISSGRVELNHAIASGLLVCVEKYIKLNGFSEDLFIDWVDFEMCWRARRMGFVLTGNADICISHCLGDSSVNFLGFELKSRSPVRHYYIVRNGVYLFFNARCLCRYDRLRLLFKTLSYFLIYPVFLSPRFTNFKMVCIGVAHGIKGRLGKF